MPTNRRQLIALLPIALLPACEGPRTPRTYFPSERVGQIIDMDARLPPMPLRLTLPRFPVGEALERLPVGSLQRLVAETMPQSPMIRQALYAVSSGGADAARADAARGPDVSTDLRMGGTDSAGREQFRRDSLGGVQGSFIIFDNGAGGLRQDRARWAIAGAAASVWERVDAVAFNVGEAAMGVRRGEALLRLADEQVAAFERLLRAVRVQAGAGISSASDIPEAEARLERVKAARVTVRATAEDAATRLKRVTGQDLARLSDGPVPNLVSEGTPENRAETHPAVRAQDAEIRAGVKSALSVDAERLGSLALQFGPSGFMQMFGGGGIWAVGSAFVRLSLPLVDSGERSARLRGAVAQLEISLAKRRDGALQVAASIRQAETALRAARDIEVIATREGAAALRLLRGKTTDWQAGIADLRSVLDAQQSATDAASKAEGARWDRRIAELRVMASSGTLAIALGAIASEDVDMESTEPYRVVSSLLTETRLTRTLDSFR